jgi:DNA-binding GntR family transcriptional regulator
MPETPPPLDTLERSETLTDKVYARLRRGLLLGVWTPGQKMTARALSRELGVSLTPVREAMMRLASEGALDVSETRSFSAVALDHDQYAEIVRIRLALEPIAAEQAAAQMTPALVAALADLNERMLAQIRAEQFAAALQLDSEFHLTLYDQARQPMLRSIIDSLWLRAGPTRNRLSHSYRRRLVGYENHKRILAALAAGDGTAAFQAVARDLSEGSRAVLEALRL